MTENLDWKNPDNTVQ